MRYRPVAKDYISWCGIECVIDVGATMRVLENTCPADQENDAYWQALDLLTRNKGITVTELKQMVTAQKGFLNFGYTLSGKRGRPYWEMKDIDTCIRWAIADFNSNDIVKYE